MKSIAFAAALTAISAATAMAADTVVTVNAVTEQGVGKPLGTVRFIDSPAGLIVQPNLKGLAPGAHGFHVHVNPNCGPAMQDGKPVAALAAGGHYDPGDAKSHLGPHAGGHLGDLPALFVDARGNANGMMAAGRLKVADLKGRALVVHAGGDNYADKPAPLGGGGARVACGVFDVK